MPLGRHVPSEAVRENPLRASPLAGGGVGSTCVPGSVPGPSG